MKTTIKIGNIEFNGVKLENVELTQDSSATETINIMQQMLSQFMAMSSTSSANADLDKIQREAAKDIETSFERIMAEGEFICAYSGSDLSDKVKRFNKVASSFIKECDRYGAKYEPNGSVTLDEFTYNILSLIDRVNFHLETEKKFEDILDQMTSF